MIFDLTFLGKIHIYIILQTINMLAFHCRRLISSSTATRSFVTKEPQTPITESVRDFLPPDVFYQQL